MSTMGLFAADGWSIDTFFSKGGETIVKWGGYIIGIVGAILLIVGVVKAAKALMSHGKGQAPNWGIIAAMILVGGVLFAGGIMAGTSSGGWQAVTNVSSAGTNLIKDLGVEG